MTSLVDFSDDDVTDDSERVTSSHVERLKSQSVQNVSQLSNDAIVSHKRTSAPAKPVRMHHASHDNILTADATTHLQPTGGDSLRRFHSTNSLAPSTVVCRPELSWKNENSTQPTSLQSPLQSQLTWKKSEGHPNDVSKAGENDAKGFLMKFINI